VRLLYTLTSYPPAVGGAQQLQHMTARELRARHDIRVVTQWDRNRTDWLLGTTLLAPMTTRDYEIDGIRVRRIGLGLRERAFLAPFVAAYYPLMDLALPTIATRLARHLDEVSDGIDLVHNIRIGREGLTEASLRLARRRDVPFVLTPVHHVRWHGWRYRAYDRLYREADALLALTHAEKEILVGIGAREERVFVIGMAPILAPDADGGRFLRAHGIDGPMVLFVAQHYAYKGYRELLAAAPLVWQRVPGARFVFVGPAVGDSEAAFRGADRRVLRLGQVDLATKTDALAACSLLCVPSTQESFGGVYVEAWSFGKPVIGCPIPAVSEVIADGVDGVLTPQDPRRIADAIVDLLQDPALAARLGAAGKRKTDERYTWRVVGRLTEEAYRRVRG
jgi:glycosyltransferase involved in cell wall biosynthesis